MILSIPMCSDNSPGKWKSWVSVCVFREWASGSCGLKRSKMLPLSLRWVWNSVFSVSTSYPIRYTTGTSWPRILSGTVEQAKLAAVGSSLPREQTSGARLLDIANQMWTGVRLYYYSAPSMLKFSAIWDTNWNRLEDLSPFTYIFKGIICWKELWFIFFRRWLSTRS